MLSDSFHYVSPSLIFLSFGAERGMESTCALCTKHIDEGYFKNSAILSVII